MRAHFFKTHTHTLNNTAWEALLNTLSGKCTKSYKEDKGKKMKLIWYHGIVFERYNIQYSVYTDSVCAGNSVAQEK